MFDDRLVKVPVLRKGQEPLYVYVKESDLHSEVNNKVTLQPSKYNIAVDVKRNSDELDFSNLTKSHHNLSSGVSHEKPHKKDKKKKKKDKKAKK